MDYDERSPEDRLRVQKWDEDHGISEKGTTAWCDARDEHVYDLNTSSHREFSSSTSRLNEDDEPR